MATHIVLLLHEILMLLDKHLVLFLAQAVDRCLTLPLTLYGLEVRIAFHIVLGTAGKNLLGECRFFVRNSYLMVEVLLLFGELAQSILHELFLLLALFEHQFLLEFT